VPGPTGPGSQKKFAPPSLAARPGGAAGAPGIGGAKGPLQRPALWGAGAANSTLLTAARPQGGAGGPQDESGAIAAFLKELGLSQYTEVLLANGFDEMDTLMHIEDADMKEVGINPCHIVKLRRRLQELHRQAGNGPDLDDSNPVVAFLKDIGLAQYAEALLQSGFDELESLVDIEDNDMKDLGIPRGHAVKLRRCLRDFQGTQECGPQTAPRKAYRVPAATRRALPITVSQAVVEQSPAPTGVMKSAVERSWEQVQAIGSSTVGELLYRHTFVLDPQIMDLFPIQVRYKYRDWTSDESVDESNVYESPALRKLFSKFVNAIGCTVAGLHDFGRLVPMLTQLGGRHAGYGLNENYWPTMGKALIFTLRDCLGDDFTSEVEAAWSMVYGFMSNIMIEGLRGALALNERKVSVDTTQLGVDDEDTASEDGSLTPGLPSECDGASKEPWYRESSNDEDASALQEEQGLNASAAA